MCACIHNYTVPTYLCMYSTVLTPRLFTVGTYMGITVPTYLVCIYIDLSFRYPYIHDNFHYAGWVFRPHSLLVMLRMHLGRFVAPQVRGGGPLNLLVRRHAPPHHCCYVCIVPMYIVSLSKFKVMVPMYISTYICRLGRFFNLFLVASGWRPST